MKELILFKLFQEMLFSFQQSLSKIIALIDMEMNYSSLKNNFIYFEACERYILHIHLLFLTPSLCMLPIEFPQESSLLNLEQNKRHFDKF